VEKTKGAAAAEAVEVELEGMPSEFYDEVCCVLVAWVVLRGISSCRFRASISCCYHHTTLMKPVCNELGNVARRT
jgi:hypothetical protein